MAARIRSVSLNEEWRLKIKTSELINRLQEHIFGTARMLPTQLKAIEILLRKTIPDLAQIDSSITVQQLPVANVFPMNERTQLPAASETMDSVH